MGETIIHNYIKNKGNDYNLIDEMIENNHSLENINKKNETIVESVLKSKNTTISIDGYRTDTKPKKLLWLLSHNAPVDSPKYTKQIVEAILLERINITQEDYQMVKTLVERNNDGMKYRNLTNYTNFYPQTFCTNVEMLDWFDNNFQINWTHPPLQIHNPIWHHLSKIYSSNSTNFKKAIWNNNSEKLSNSFNNFKKIISWLKNKNFSVFPLNYDQNNYNFIAESVLSLFNSEIIQFLYNQNFKIAGGDFTIWRNCIDNLTCNLGSNHTHSNQAIPSNLEFFPKANSVFQCYVWGLLHGKIPLDDKGIPLGVIRRFDLQLDNFKKAKLKKNKNNMQISCHDYDGFKIHLLCIFEEDVIVPPYFTSNMSVRDTPVFKIRLKKKIKDLEIKYDLPNKEECRKRQLEIIDFLKLNQVV